MSRQTASARPADATFRSHAAQPPTPPLARSALSGQRIADCDPVAFTDGGFGPASYDDTAARPDGVLRASLGCGNPCAVAELRAGETVLDLGSGGGIDVLLSARRVSPHGTVFGLDASPAMVELARRNAEQAGVANVQFLQDDRGDPAARPHSDNPLPAGPIST
ncbi:MAG TPA: methyltransferase domain-containing protein [Nonomuraea sp.]|nr:methyltransferase domain-containing protein [Nonomuraea sp.]